MNNILIRRLSPALAVLLLAGSAWAKDNVPHADAAFMKKAAESGLAEVEASKIASTKAANTQVKGFATQMVDDHTKANDELKALAASKDVKLPAEPGMADKAKIKLLDGRDGTSFDKHYADSWGVKAHEDTVRLFEKEAKDGKDADVKAWAEKTLPALRHHLEMAKDLKAATDKEGKDAGKKS